MSGTAPSSLAADYDDAAKRWTVTLKQSDGSERVMHPRHVVFCNGVSTIPKSPKLPGLEEFKGVVRHSGDYGSGLDWTGKRALVLGTGTSGHDVAQDLAVSGARVAMIQNGPTLVVSLKEAQSPYALYDEDIPFEDCDLLAMSFPYPIYQRSHQQITKKNAEADRALLEGLKQRGFKLTFGPDGTGWQIMYQSRGGGYYFDAGCSQMIVDGRIGLIQFDDIERFCAEGALMQGRQRAASRPDRAGDGLSRPEGSRAPHRRRKDHRPHRSPSGVSTRRASSPACGGRPVSPACGSSAAGWRNAGSFPRCWRCRSRRGSWGLWGEGDPRSRFDPSTRAARSSPPPMRCFLKCNLVVLTKYDPTSSTRAKEFIVLAFTKRVSIATALLLGVVLSMPLSVPAFSDSPQSNTAMESQSAQPLRPGDLVKLRSGGPLMTVGSIKDDQVECFWTGEDGAPNAENFPVAVLRKY